MNNQPSPTLWRQLVPALSIVVGFVLAAFGVFPFLYWSVGLDGQEHSWGECTYFSIVTITTTGYGDIQPVEVGRFIACCEMVTSVGLLVFAWGYALTKIKD